MKVKPFGVIALPVYVADRMVDVKFLGVDTLSDMNVIIGREWIHVVKGLVSTLHQVMRCQSPDRFYMIDIKGDQSQRRMCYNIESREEEQIRVRKMTKGQIKRFDKAKNAEEERPEDGSNK